MKVTSKIGNSLLLLQNKKTSPYIPPIQSFSKQNLFTMLQKAPFVYIKPNDSAQGKGILRVDRQDHGKYMLRSRDTKITSIHENSDQLWSQLNQVKRKRTYIIQQSVKSVTRAEKPFDIRVHVSRINGEWIIAGIVARLASKANIVTNAYSGGISLHVHEVLLKHMNLSNAQSDQLIRQLKSLSLHATKAMSKRYPKWSEFGLDIGLDENLHPWIYEINITPGGLVFKNLDRETYLRVLQCHRLAR